MELAGERSGEFKPCICAPLQVLPGPKKDREVRERRGEEGVRRPGLTGQFALSCVPANLLQPASHPLVVPQRRLRFAHISETIFLILIMIIRIADGKKRFAVAPVIFHAEVKGQRLPGRNRIGGHLLKNCRDENLGFVPQVVTREPC